MDTYDFESKHLYRQRRESAIDRMCTKSVILRRVAYLDTGEALDTMSYLRRGYRPENLWAINRNPAEVAHLTRTLRNNRMPDINTVGLDFEDALNRRVPEVDIVDFDGMSQLHDKLVDMLYRITVTRPRAVYGLTILAGREVKDTIYNTALKESKDPTVRDMMRGSSWPRHTSFGTEIDHNHIQRLMFALWGLYSPRRHEHGRGVSYPCRVHLTKMLWDVYVSTSHQSMLWCVASCQPHRPLKFSDVHKIFRDTNGLCIPECELPSLVAKSNGAR